MFEIFIAIIGLTYYLTRIGKDIGDGKKYDAMINDWENWIEKYRDDKLQRVVKDKILRSDPEVVAQLDEICEDLPIYNSYRKRCYEKYFCRSMRDTGPISLAAELDCYIIMASKGFVPNTFGMGETLRFSIAQRNFKYNSWHFEMYKEIMFWIEKKLKEHDVPKSDLVCIRPMDSYAGKLDHPLYCDGHLARLLDYDTGYSNVYWTWTGALMGHEKKVGSFDELYPDYYP